MSAIATINHFSKLIFLRNKPEELPYSNTTWFALLVLSLIAYCIAYRDSKALGILSLIFCIENLTSLMTLYYVLKVFKKESRFIQVSCNLLGISLLNTILLQALTSLTQNKLILCMYIGWIIMLKVHVIEHSFDVSKYRALLLLIVLVSIPFIILLIGISLFVPFLPMELLKN